MTDWHLLDVAARHDCRLVTFDRTIARTVAPDDAHPVLTLGG